MHFKDRTFCLCQSKEYVLSEILLIDGIKCQPKCPLLHLLIINDILDTGNRPEGSLDHCHITLDHKMKSVGCHMHCQIIRCIARDHLSFIDNDDLITDSTDLLHDMRA